MTNLNPKQKKQVKFKLRRGLQTKEYKFRIPLTEFWKSMLVLQEGITISEIQKDINYFAFYLKFNQIVVEYEIVNRHIFNTFSVPDFKDYGQLRWTLALSVSRKLGLFNYFFCFFFMFLITNTRKKCCKIHHFKVAQPPR